MNNVELYGSGRKRQTINYTFAERYPLLFRYLAHNC